MGNVISAASFSGRNRNNRRELPSSQPHWQSSRFDRSLYSVSNETFTSGRDLYLMAQRMLSEREYNTVEYQTHWPQLKEPKNFREKFIYMLAAMSTFNCNQREQVASLNKNEKTSAVSKTLPHPETKADVHYSQVPSSVTEHYYRARRDTQLKPKIQDIGWKYTLAALLKKNIAVELELEELSDFKLASAILISLKNKPRLKLHIARLTLKGQKLYGERIGEYLTPEQQKALIGQATCQLIFNKNNIAIRMASLFEKNRDTTISEFKKLIDIWPGEKNINIEKELWQKNYESFEMPTLFLYSVHKLSQYRSSRAKKYSKKQNIDNIWVGSLNWALMHFGARSLLLSGRKNFEDETYITLIDIGLGVLNLYKNGMILEGTEAIFYLGLLLYHLKNNPESTIDALMDKEIFEKTKNQLFEDALNLQKEAQNIYEKFENFQILKKEQPWQSIRVAAEELLKTICNEAIPERQSFLSSLFSKTDNPVDKYLSNPQDSICQSNKKKLPDLNKYYNSVIDTFTDAILRVDLELLNIAFSPGDVKDHGITEEQLDFIESAKITMISLEITRNRDIREMYFGGRVEKHISKNNVAFFIAEHNNSFRLLILLIDNGGYQLKIHEVMPLENMEYIIPYMQSFPIGKIRNGYSINFRPLKHPPIIKKAGAPIEDLYEAYAGMHHNAYKSRLLRSGMTEETSTLKNLANDITGMVIPFFSCLTSINEKDVNSAFIECTIDGALIGIPIFFAGIKHTLSIYKITRLGVKKIMENDVFIASRERVYPNPFPISNRVAGGVSAFSYDIQAMNILLAQDIMHAVDPGVKVIGTLATLAKGVFMSLGSKLILKSPKLVNQLLSLSQESHRFFSVRTSRFFSVKYSYADDGVTPLTASFDEYGYTVFDVQNKIIASETGELSLRGEPIMVRLDAYTQAGMFAKFTLKPTENERYEVIVKNTTITRFYAVDLVHQSNGHPLAWRLHSEKPILSFIIYPHYTATIADSSRFIFEMNDYRWALDPLKGILSPIDNLDYWTIESLNETAKIPLAQIADDSMSVLFKFNDMKVYDKLFTVAYAPETATRNIENVLPSESCQPNDVEIYNATFLKSRIDNRCILIEPEANRPTFLLSYPIEKSRVKFRVSYDFIREGFIYSSPIDILHSHRYCSFLSEAMHHHYRSSIKINKEILLPLLFNGAISYNNLLMLKKGDHNYLIKPINNLHYTISFQRNGFDPWILRYELFTGNFIAVTKQKPSLYLNPHQSYSIFENLALRQYGIDKYPNLTSLCLYTPSTEKDKNFHDSNLSLRLKQTSLLLRLDPMRREELLHSSQACLREFELSVDNNAIKKYPILAIWTEFEKIRSKIDKTNNVGPHRWNFKFLTRLDEIITIEGTPKLISYGPDMQLYLRFRYYKDQFTDINIYKKLIVTPGNISLEKVNSSKGLSLWIEPMRNYNHIPVTKFFLNIKSSLKIWVSTINEVWIESGNDKIFLKRDEPSYEIKESIVSPNSNRIAIISFRSALSQSSLFIEIYNFDVYKINGTEKSLEAYEKQIIVDNYSSDCDWWLTDKGYVYLVSGNKWHKSNNKDISFPTPEGYIPKFISPDQFFLGYKPHKSDDTLSDTILYDISQEKYIHLKRSHLNNIDVKNDCIIVGIAFSSINTMAAIAYSDGYVEIFSLVDISKNNSAKSLGHAQIPMAYHSIIGTIFPKFKNVALQFNNAFDRLLVFYDEGFFTTEDSGKGNGTYCLGEIKLQTA